MTKILKKLLAPLMGKVKHQQLFEKIHLVTLKAMHVGVGESADKSGEDYVINYICKKLENEQDITLFDVGANIGDYAVLLNTIFKENARILCFEPSKKTYQKLITNTINIPYISHYNVGFGSEETKLQLYSNADESVLASIYNRRLDHFGIAMNHVEHIDITTVDKFCIENSIDKIHFLKLDVEGHELKVLEGAKNMLAGVDFIQFEFGGCNIDSRTFFQDFFYLLKDKFRIYRVVKNGLYEIKAYREIYESFLTTNYLAERINA